MLRLRSQPPTHLCPHVLGLLRDRKIPLLIWSCPQALEISTLPTPHPQVSGFRGFPLPASPFQDRVGRGPLGSRAEEGGNGWGLTDTLFSGCGRRGLTTLLPRQPARRRGVWKPCLLLSLLPPVPCGSLPRIVPAITNGALCS